MELGREMMKLLSKTYEPQTTIETKFKRYDLAFKTDDKGRPVLLFMGHKDAKGNIVGERFARRLKEDDQGMLIKDHWESKGKAS
ncbi:hypothetical protein GCM10027037_09360 [Mucilaginibacter koreensis]